MLIWRKKPSIKDDLAGVEVSDPVLLHKRQINQPKLVDEFVDEGIPSTEPGFGNLEADTQRVIEESLKNAHEVKGKGKEKVGVEQAAQVLLNLETTKKKSPAEQYIFHRRTSTPTEPTSHEESSSLYVELGLIK
ncbi:hypothetical protein Tco_0465385 [Tanacetum coccineum]